MYAQIALLERSARLYLVLADQSVLVPFHDHGQRISEIAGALHQQLRAPSAHAALNALTDELDHIRSLVLLDKPPAARIPPGRAEQIDQAFTRLGELTSDIATAANAQIDADVATLQRQTDRARRELYLES